MYEGCRVEEGWERGGSKGLRKGEGIQKRIGQGKEREKGQDIVGGGKGESYKENEEGSSKAMRE